MKKSATLLIAAIAVTGFAGNAFAQDTNNKAVGASRGYSLRNLDLTMNDNQVAIATGYGTAIAAQGNVVDQVMSVAYTFDGGMTILKATEPSLQGSASANASSGGSEGMAWSSGGGSGSSSAQATSPTSTGVSQSVSQTSINNGVGASVNSVSMIAVNSPTQIAVGGSYSSMSNSAVGGSVSGVSGSVGK